MICLNFFYLVRNEISAGTDKRHRISHFFVRSQLKFRFWLHKKRWLT